MSRKEEERKKRRKQREEKDEKQKNRFKKINRGGKIQDMALIQSEREVYKQREIGERGNRTRERKGKGSEV